MGPCLWPNSHQAILRPLVRLGFSIGGLLVLPRCDFIGIYGYAGDVLSGADALSMGSRRGAVVFGAPDWSSLSRVDENHPRGPRLDAQGRVVYSPRWQSLFATPTSGLSWCTCTLAAFRCRFASPSRTRSPAARAVGRYDDRAGRAAGPASGRRPTAGLVGDWAPGRGDRLSDQARRLRAGRRPPPAPRNTARLYNTARHVATASRSRGCCPLLSVHNPTAVVRGWTRSR